MTEFVPIGTDLTTQMAKRGMEAKVPIPPSIPKVLSSIETNSMYYEGRATIHPSFPKKVFSQRRQFWTNADKIEVAPPRVLRGKNIVYHGMQRRDVFYMSLGLGQRPLWTLGGNEFGPGLYFTYDPQIAKAYAGPGGVLIAVDWSNEGGHLSKKILRGGEWTRQVKNYVCMGTSVGSVAPERFDYDFIIGPMTVNHDNVRTCENPVAGTDDQIVARSNEACDYMSRNLISIIWIE